MLSIMFGFAHGNIIRATFSAIISMYSANILKLMFKGRRKLSSIDRLADDFAIIMLDLEEIVNHSILQFTRR